MTVGDNLIDGYGACRGFYARGQEKEERTSEDGKEGEGVGEGVKGRARACINFDIRTERERRREFADLSIVVLRTAARTRASATPLVLYDIGQDRATRLFNRCIMQIDITAPLRMQ